MQPFKITWRPNRGYFPTAPLTGDLADYVFRGLNMLVKGGRGMTYLEAWRGHSTIGLIGAHTALTGTISTEGVAGFPFLNWSGSGTQTKFRSELMIGQSLLYNGQLFVVKRIVSDTTIEVDPIVDFMATGLPAYFLPRIQEVDTERATFFRGAVIKLPRGHYMGVGSGVARINESTLNSSWTLSDNVSIALFANNAYSIHKLGMRKPTLTTVTGVVGGTKNMPAGTYSVRIAPYRSATGGFNQASEAKEVTIAAGDKIRVTFPAMDAGQDGWRVYGSPKSTGPGTTGPWYEVQTITTSHVSSAGGTYDFEWLDAEVTGGDLLEYDNNTPPPAAGISSLGGIPILIGTNGPDRTLAGTVATTAGSDSVTGTGTSFNADLAIDALIYINNLLYRVTEIISATSMKVDPAPNAAASGLSIRTGDTAPGPVLRPAKPYGGGFNIEAFPARFAIALSPPETIMGFIEGDRSLFLMTRNRLHVAELSGDANLPVITKPFWKVGFRNPNALVFVNGYLYGYTTNGATRSVGAGDRGAEEHEFAAPVAEDMGKWNAAKVSVAYDPENESVCYMHADDGIYRDGRRYSTILMYMLRLGGWSPPLRVESNLGSLAITSAATVNGQLYFVGALGAESNVHTWSRQGIAGNAYAAMPFVDVGAEGYDKTIKGLSLTGHARGPIVADIYGATVEEDIPLEQLESGAASASGNITFDVGGKDTYARISRRAKLNVRRQRVFAVRVEMPIGEGNPARLDEMVIDGEIGRLMY